jgi:hypothetical protein
MFQVHVITKERILMFVFVGYLEHASHRGNSITQHDTKQMHDGESQGQTLHSTICHSLQVKCSKAIFTTYSGHITMSQRKLWQSWKRIQSFASRSCKISTTPSLIDQAVLLTLHFQHCYIAGGVIALSIEKQWQIVYPDRRDS